MMIKIAACLFAVALLAGCQTTETTKRETLHEMKTRYASSGNTSDLNNPAPPAEGPENVPAASPLLRENAAGDP
jgi:uncharacterized lipoprotein